MSATLVAGARVWYRRANTGEKEAGVVLHVGPRAARVRFLGRTHSMRLESLLPRHAPDLVDEVQPEEAK